jgi:hypothetical protein
MPITDFANGMLKNSTSSVDLHLLIMIGTSLFFYAEEIISQMGIFRQEEFSLTENWDHLPRQEHSPGCCSSSLYLQLGYAKGFGLQ